MALPTPKNVDPDLLEDFAIEFNEAYEFCEQKLVELEQTPDDEAIVHQLFRSIHTVKGNLTFIAFDAAIPILQAVEDVLSAIRDKVIPFSSNIGDLALLSLDRTQAMVEEIEGQDDSGLSAELVVHIGELIAKVAEASDKERDTFIHAAILELDPNTLALEPGKSALPSDDISLDDAKPQPEAEATEPAPSGELHSAEFPVDDRLLKLLQTYSVQVDSDLRFFLGMMTPLEARSVYWSGRSLRLLLLSLGMNRASGGPVDPTQLAAAVVMHDISMAFLPLDILHKDDALTEEERLVVQEHVHSSHRLLSQMQHWQSAAEMVLQHHERPDGSGYPGGLKEDEICDGAKILAIVDSFDAIYHSRSYTTKVKRPFIRAVLEINSHVNNQFSAKWVEIFNPVVKKLNNLNLL